MSQLARRLVIKMGSSTLTRADGHLNEQFMRRVATSVADLQAEGCRIVLVSSGAVAAGRGLLPESRAQTTIPARQMLAAIGQPRLMATWSRVMATHQLLVAQTLLTQGDIADRRGYLSARSTLLALLDHSIVPIVNENDVVADDELRFGDNDRLSAVVASLIDADLLILLSDVDGLYENDPRTNPTARPIRRIKVVNDAVMALAKPSSSGMGTGGMITKLLAAQQATAAGVEVVIALGTERNVIKRAASGRTVGTRFVAASRRTARRSWLHARLGRKGRVQIDDGAAAALERGNNSLLPAGIRDVSGAFQRGDPVDVTRLDGSIVAHGLVAYDATDLHRVKGRQSSEILDILGYHYGDEAIHRDNLALV